jgi:membrane protein
MTEKWNWINFFKCFFKNDVFVYAASISFCALISIIPLAMLMVSAAGYVLGSSDEVFNQLVKGFSDFIPWGREVFLANLQSMMEKKSHLGLIGAGFLIFLASLLVSSIELPFDKIFRIDKSRNFFHSRLLAVGMIFLVTLLLFVPTVATIVQVTLERFGIYIPLAELVTSKFYFFMVLFISYVMIIVIIPNKKVYLRYALVGGVVFSVGIGITKYIFQYYLTFSMTRYDIIYGSLNAVILAVVWIYYMSLVLLLSAEFVSEIQHRGIFHRNKALLGKNEEVKEEKESK